MAQKYFSFVTDVGTAQISNATVTGTFVELTEFAVGDGGGAYYVPNPQMDALVNEVWRGKITKITQDVDNPNQITISAILPVTTGGFIIREMAVFDADGNMFAVANTADIPKVAMDSGMSDETELQIVVVVGNAGVIQIEINPSVIIATKSDLQQLESEMQSSMDTLRTEVQEDLAELRSAVTPVVAALVLHTDDWVGTPNMPLASSAAYDDSTGVYTLTFSDFTYTPEMLVAFAVPQAVASAASVSIAIGSLTFAMDSVPAWQAEQVVALKLTNSDSNYTASESSTEYGLEAPWKHPIESTHVNASTKIDLAASLEILQQMATDGTASMMAENKNGVAQVVALGNKPTVDISIQAMYTEVKEL